MSVWLSVALYIYFQECSIKKGLLKISQNSHKNICVGVSFNKVQDLRAAIKTRLRYRCFFRKFLKTPFLANTSKHSSSKHTASLIVSKQFTMIIWCNQKSVPTFIKASNFENTLESFMAFCKKLEPSTKQDT